MEKFSSPAGRSSGALVLRVAIGTVHEVSNISSIRYVWHIKPFRHRCWRCTRPERQALPWELLGFQIFPSEMIYASCALCALVRIYMRSYMGVTPGQKMMFDVNNHKVNEARAQLGEAWVLLGDELDRQASKMFHEDGCDGCTERNIQ